MIANTDSGFKIYNVNGLVLKIELIHDILDPNVEVALDSEIGNQL